MLIHTFNLSRFVRYADCQHTTISISHCYNGDCQCLGIYLYALQVKCLTFLSCSYLFYCDHIECKITNI